MEETNNTERGPISENAMGTEKKPAHIVLGMPRNSGSEAEGRTPIVIHGDENKITIIERQYNDRTAAETVKSMLDADKAQGEMVKEFIGKIFEIGSLFMPKKGLDKDESPKNPDTSNPAAASTTKKSVEDEKREKRNARQRSRRAAAKKAPVKKKVKKSTSKRKK